MSFLVEDGAGFPEANSLVTISFIDSYASDRGVASWTGENSAKQAAAIAATDYLEKRFGHRFLGDKLYSETSYAKTLMTLTALPDPGSEVTLGSETIPLEPEATILETLEEFIDYVNTFTDFAAELAFGLSVRLFASVSGPEGNSQETSSTSDAVTFSSTTFLGGNFESLEQALSFPRTNIYTKNGISIKGVPLKIKQAVAEYAIRALSGTLMPDPELTNGQIIQRSFDKVGPIENEVSYLRGVLYSMGSFPAADSLLREFMASGGGVYR
jgi:hypothetical protein